MDQSDASKSCKSGVVARSRFMGIRGSELRVEVECPLDSGISWKGIALVYRNKREEDACCYEFPTKELRRRKQAVVLAARIDLSRLELTPLYWDLRVVYHADGSSEKLYAKIKDRALHGARRSMRKAWRVLKRTVHSDSFCRNDGWRIDLYRTKGRNYALVYQSGDGYTGLSFKLKERAAVISSFLFARPLARKKIFLCYEKYCSMAQDNGFYFFKYCMDSNMEQAMDRSIYYVIDTSAPDYQERLLPYASHVVNFMSFKHMVYLLSARLLISSDSKAHAYSWRNKESIILPRVLNRKKLAFLQHGVIALKKVNFYKKGDTASDMFVTSNDRERDLIIHEMGYEPDEVVVTGLARWDALKDLDDGETTILVMPTWRNWLEEARGESFAKSEYCETYLQLLNDPKLQKFLEEKDVYINFYIHPKFHDYLGAFKANCERVRLIPFGSVPLNQLIMQCRMLITDYSSVSWDAFYLGKPVLFFQFDLETYMETTGSYIDMDTELFGDRAFKTDDLVRLIEEYEQSGYAIPDVYMDKRDHCFKYIDTNNSERICREIAQRGW